MKRDIKATSLTNSDLVEVDEYIVYKLNKDLDFDAQKFEQVDKKRLLAMSDEWHNVVLDEEDLKDGTYHYFYTINLSYVYKNRKFEVMYRIKDELGRACQFIQFISANADGRLVIPIQCKAGENRPDIIDIWYRLLIPPTGQYPNISDYEEK